ncbi:MAG: HAD family hydrolase [Deltaproteobacteria bacterium]|nr:MAG: HAD family hydrolase [Deltaproteobacteria bacterium]
MRYQAVIFDLDGTLLDTLADLAASMNHVLARFGLPTHAVEAYKYFVGGGMENLARRALPEERRDETTVAQCFAALMADYNQRWIEHTHPYPGIPELLEGLTARRIRMTILSNKPDDFSKMCVAQLLSDWQFELVVGVRPEGPIKPDPAGALEIAAALKLPPSAFLYLGDTSTDMQTATAAGMFAVGALWGFRTAQELTSNGARVLIARPPELLDLL